MLHLEQGSRANICIVSAQTHTLFFAASSVLLLSFSLGVMRKDRCSESMRCWIPLSALRLGDGVVTCLLIWLSFMLKCLGRRHFYAHPSTSCICFVCQQVMNCAFVGWWTVSQNVACFVQCASWLDVLDSVHLGQAHVICDEFIVLVFRLCCWLLPD
mgnify:CR=1 FL=1